MIRNQNNEGTLDQSSVSIKQQAMPRSRKARPVGLPKFSVLAVYSAIFALIITVVAVGYRPPEQAQLANATDSNVAGAPAAGMVNLDKPSVDELVATNIAANLAESNNMAVAPKVAELSSSLAAKIDLAQTSDLTISKPQITELIGGGKSIAKYTVQPGDTATTVASAHGLSVDTIRWANNLSSDALEPGRELSIPPIDGVIYTIKAGDTPATLAATYQADEKRIAEFNNVKEDGFEAGSVIVIPAGIMPVEQRPGYQEQQQANAAAAAANSSQSYGGSTGYRVGSNFAGASAGNRYAFGNCTWYAYERRVQLGLPVGSFWGNASTWDDYARAAGFPVSNRPSVGALLIQNTGYYGHVGVVETVNGDGSITISEMNNYAYGGFNIVNYRTISAGQAAGYTYIQ